MANTIKIKRSAVPSKVPATGDLALGELALNTYDGKLYTKKDNGTASIVELSPNALTDANIASGAEIAVSKLADGTARQLLQTDAAGTGVEWTSNVDIPGTLDVTSAATFDGTISFPLGTAALPSIYPGTDTNTGFWSPAADTLAISNNGSETLRTDSSQRLLVGVTSGNANGGVLQLKSGITFPATPVAATDVNTLDEYEEGTLTPTIQGTTTAGTGTYTTQVGAYVKIGRITYVTGTVVWTAHTGTGNLRMAGLPFTVGSDALGQLTYVNLTVTGTPYLEVIDNQTYCDVFTLPSAGGSRSAVAMDTAATIEFSFCYRASI